MDDMTGEIAKILADENSMAQIREMAGKLFGENGALGGTPPEKSGEENSPLGNLEGLGLGSLDLGEFGLGSIDLPTLIRLGKALKSGGQNDGRAALLTALKPHLSPERREKVDTAVKILRLISLIPILREEGILK